MSRTARNGRVAMAEEIYYIIINPFRIENYMTVLPPHIQPL